MRRAPLALAAAATLGLATIAAPAPAEARWGHGGWGPGLAGGLLAGAVIGGIASSAYAYGPGYGYYGGYPGYYGGYYGGYAPAYYGGYYDDPYPVVRYRRVIRPVETQERIIVGTKVPTDVELEAVPSDWGPSVTKYRYVYSNNRVMLVDPATRTVVHEID